MLAGRIQGFLSAVRIVFELDVILFHIAVDLHDVLVLPLVHPVQIGPRQFNALVTHCSPLVYSLSTRRVH